jgi:Na+-driven multidrug efflux pump
VSLPVGLLLAFSFKLGLLGLWSGMAVAEIVVVAFFLFFIFRMVPLFVGELFVCWDCCMEQN